MSDIVSVFELLRRRYEPPAWAFLEEVRNGTGYGRVTRTADALAMSLYPSRGLHLHGFEVKVSRGDWVKELKDPDKAEEIARFCHYWWLAIGDAKIVQNGEVPMTWGLLVSDGKKLTVEREPTLNKDALPPTHAFLAAILRKVCSTSTDQVRIDRAHKEGHEEGWKEGLARGQEFSPEGSQWSRLKSDHEELKTVLARFEQQSGIRIDRWTGGKIAGAVRILTSDWNSPVEILKQLAHDADRLSEQTKLLLNEFKTNAAVKAVSETQDHPEAA